MLMTSEEMKNVRAGEITEREWLRVIAYQLAKINERLAERPVDVNVINAVMTAR